MPARTGLQTLELALEDADIPYRLETPSLVYATQEIQDLLNCLSAIDDPTDQVSVVAALRSPAFACSDVDLLEFVEAGGEFDYLAEGDADAPPGCVFEALAVLKAFHDRRRWLSPAALIEEFLRERRLMELALDDQRPRERWRRYRFLVERAQAFAAAGETSLRSFIEWAGRQREKDAVVRETPIPESDEDAVRVMTVHGAKGLEFPVLVLTGLNSTPTPPARPRVVRPREWTGRGQGGIGGVVLSNGGLPGIGRRRQATGRGRVCKTYVRCGHARPRSPHR